MGDVINHEFTRRPNIDWAAFADIPPEDRRLYDALAFLVNEYGWTVVYSHLWHLDAAPTEEPPDDDPA